MTCYAGPAPRQAEVLRFLAEYIDRHGYPPTRREICEALGASPVSYAAAQHHLDRLEAKGFVRLTRTAARGIALTDAGRDFVHAAAEPSTGAGADGGA